MMADAIAAKRGVPIAIARASVHSGSLSETASSGAPTASAFLCRSAIFDPDVRRHVGEKVCHTAGITAARFACANHEGLLSKLANRPGKNGWQ